MIKKKHRKEDWHHRVPDFKLVYCGTKKYKKEDPKKQSNRKLEASPQNVS